MKERDVYFASCVRDGGIFHYRLNEHGVLRFMEKVSCPFPMYMARDSGMLHVILRHPFKDNDFSGILSYRIGTDGSLYEPSGMMDTRGRCGCHLCSFRGRLYAVNYLSGNVFCSHGIVRTHRGHGKDAVRQDAPHPHYIGPAPDGRYLLVTDLGLDKIFVYDADLNTVDCADMPAGSGPRHIAVIDSEHVACVNELDCSVTMLEYRGGGLRPLQTLSTPVSNHLLRASGAAIRADGSHIYVSNRADNTIYTIGTEEGSMKLEYAAPCGGETPRDFVIAGEYILCANQDSSTATVFRTAQGKMRGVMQKTEIHIANVLCVCGG